MPDSQNPTLTGAVKVTPLSVRGTAGESSSISVELSTKMPVIQFAEPIDRFVFGEQRNIPCTMQYVDKCDITAPEGWTVELDIAASMLKVTAPAEGVGIPAGTVTLDAVSAEELTESFETQLSLKGIATGDDFVAFGKAVTEAAPLDEFMQEGTVILLQDVDLSAFSQTCFVGQAENPFTGTFDGKGHTLTVSLNDGDAKELGLFHTLDATAAVKNLTLAGSMTVTQPNPGVAGTLAIYNNGAALTGVTNTATVTYSADKTNSTSGYLGGLVGQDKAGSTYTDCHNTGMFNIPGSGRTMFIGGIVGGALINTKGSLTNCSNSGKFEFNFSNKPDSGMFGGLVGSAEKAFWNFTDCTNEGNFSVTFADPGHQYHSLGGILGNGYGTFVRCINKGDITFGTAKGTNYRRTGGIIGCVGANDDAIDFQRTLSMSDCRNEGDLAASTASLGGIIGIAEKIDTPAVIENCENKGHISSPSMADYDVYYFSGIAGNLNTHLHINDVVLGGTLRYLDTDMRLVGQWKPGTADAPVEEFHSDDRLLEVADEALANAGITHITGIIASGNYFVDTPQKVEEVIRLTGADAVEMEGAAVAQVAARNNVPALVIRALSDNADTDYEVFKEFDISEYADTAARLAVDIVKRL